MTKQKVRFEKEVHEQAQTLSRRDIRIADLETKGYQLQRAYDDLQANHDETTVKLNREK